MIVIPSSAVSFEFFSHPLLFLFLLLLHDIFGREAMKRKGEKYSVVQLLPKAGVTSQRQSDLGFTL